MDLKQILEDHKLWLEGKGGKRANLNGTDLSMADLRVANLYRANLRRADLRGANLSEANLCRANLFEADLSGADLYEANLSGADLRGAKRGGCTIKNLRSSIRRSDSYTFFLWDTEQGWRVNAGCRWFTFKEAEKHWKTTRGDTQLGRETMDILRFFRARAKSHP